MLYKNILFVFAFMTMIFIATGCAMFTPERVAAIHQTVATALQIAYETGGKTLLDAKINEMVANGDITVEQGDLLKEAAQNGYEAFLAMLNELAEKNE